MSPRWKCRKVNRTFTIVIPASSYSKQFQTILVVHPIKAQKISSSVQKAPSMLLYQRQLVMEYRLLYPGAVRIMERLKIKNQTAPDV